MAAQFESHRGPIVSESAWYSEELSLKTKATKMIKVPTKNVIDPIRMAFVLKVCSSSLLARKYAPMQNPTIMPPKLHAIYQYVL
jgi:hypothetical protein